MTTAEMTTTMTMLNRLSRPQVKNVQNYIQILLNSRKNREPDYKPLTRDEFIAKIEKSEEDIAMGRVKTWEEFREESRKKYGF